MVVCQKMLEKLSLGCAFTSMHCIVRCKKTESLDKLEKQHYVTMCLFEQFFQPSFFFDIMVHLTVYLVDQVRLCGSVHLCWMYPFERNMKLLKGNVRNHCRPKGCVAECYVAEEALEFCAEYLSNHDFIGLPPSCLVDYTIEKPLGRGEIGRAHV